MDIKITDIAVANPRLKLSQQQVLQLLNRHGKFSTRVKALYKRFLMAKGIQSRYFSARNIKEFFSENQDQLIRRFQDSAVRLSAASLEKCVRGSGISKKRIGCIVISTCTGYLCPGLTSYVIEKSGLRRDIFATDIAGMGCGGALPALRTCQNFLNSNKDSYALMISTEICSSTIFWGNHLELILSNSIFGDGSAACLLTNRKRARGFRMIDFESKIEPQHREMLRFRTQNSRLRNVIKESVPETAAVLTKEIANTLLKRHGLSLKDIRFWALHPGGKKVLDRIQSVMDLDAHDLDHSRDVLLNYGNMSSPTVVYVLKKIHQNQRLQAGDLVFMASFGAGFSGYAVLLRYE